MKFVGFTILVLGLLALIALIAHQKGLLQGSPKQEGPWPFFAKRVMSNPEQVAYFRLIEALPDLLVLPQVNLSSFLEAKKVEKRQGWLNRINRKSVDFLICTKDASTLAAIEIDDKTHERADRIKADQDKDRAITDAGVTILRWKVGNMPDAESIKSIFAGLVARHQAAPIAAKKPRITVAKKAAQA